MIWYWYWSYMENRVLSRSDLIACLGDKERVSEVLNRKRGLSSDDSAIACWLRYPR
jgi:antitoxin component HigA of HigAB toxin-antitoxin module